MRRAFGTAILIVTLAGCGGVPAPSSPGFVNQTQHADADLWAIWQSAQRSVAQQIDLNPVEQELSDAPPDIRPGDPRALNLQPLQVQVTAENDVSAGALYAATALVRPDPTGLIACPQPCNVRFAPAYSRCSRRATAYAQSWETQEDNFRLILQYEFESHILYALGYDVKWR